MNTAQLRPARTNRSEKRFTVLPTILFYAAGGAMFLGVLYSNGWLFAAGLLVALPMALPLFGGALVLQFAMRNMRKHPELYETKITEDEQGNITEIKWVKVR